MPRYISEAVGMIGKCRNWSDFIIFGLILMVSNVKMNIMTVIRFKSVYNRAEAGKDMPMQADSQIGMRPNMYEHALGAPTLHVFPSSGCLTFLEWHA